MLCNDCINKDFCYGEICGFTLNGKEEFFCDEYVPEYDEELLQFCEEK